MKKKVHFSNFATRRWHLKTVSQSQLYFINICTDFLPNNTNGEQIGTDDFFYTCSLLDILSKFEIEQHCKVDLSVPESSLNHADSKGLLLRTVFSYCAYFSCGLPARTHSSRIWFQPTPSGGQVLLHQWRGHRFLHGKHKLSGRRTQTRHHWTSGRFHSYSRRNGQWGKSIL